MIMEHFDESLEQFMQRAQDRRPKANTGASDEYIAKVRGEVPVEIKHMDDVKSDLIQIIRTKFPKYQFTPDIIQAIKTFAQVRMVEESMRPFFIQGTVGSGKTALFRDILPAWPLKYQNKRHLTHQFVSVHDLVMHYEAGKHLDLMERYAKKNICIDDLGSEKQAFGKEEFLITFLEMRYALNHKVRTDIITNLSFTEILNRYGERIESRCAEGVRLIINSEQDLRKSKQ